MCCRRAALHHTWLMHRLSQQPHACDDDRAVHGIGRKRCRCGNPPLTAGVCTACTTLRLQRCCCRCVPTIRWPAAGANEAIINWLQKRQASNTQPQVQQPPPPATRCRPPPHLPRRRNPPRHAVQPARRWPGPCREAGRASRLHGELHGRERQPGGAQAAAPICNHLLTGCRSWSGAPGPQGKPPWRQPEPP